MVAAPFPSVSKEGCLRLNKKIPFRSGADGVVSKSRVASLHARVAFLILFEFTNHPACAAKERALFIHGAGSPPLKGGEWSRLGSKPVLVLRPASQPVGT